MFNRISIEIHEDGSILLGEEIWLYYVEKVGAVKLIKDLFLSGELFDGDMRDLAEWLTENTEMVCRIKTDEDCD